MRARNSGKLVVCSIASMALAITAVSPALASDAEISAADAVAAVSPESGNVSTPVLGDSVLTATAGNVTTEIPVEGKGDVTVSQPGLDDLSVTLPEGLAVGGASVSADGTVVYESLESADVSLAVQSLKGGGVSVQTVVESARAAHSFTYSVAEESLLQRTDDGGIDILSAAESGMVVTGRVEAPWAYDANGEAVPTSYSVSGNEFTQIISPAEGAIYPIVADPTFGHTYLVPTAYLNKAETKKASTIVGFTGICVSLGTKIPIPAISVLCAANATSLAHNAAAISRKGQCMKILIGPGVTAGIAYTGGNCK